MRCRAFGPWLLVQILIASLAFVRTAHAGASAYSQYDGAYTRARGAAYDLLCPTGARRAHLVVVVPSRESDGEGEANVYARRGFAVALPHGAPGAAAVSELARAVPKTSPCVIDDGRVALVGALGASDVVLAALRDGGFARVARVVVLPSAVRGADSGTLVFEASSRALDMMAATSEPTIAAVDGLTPCDFRTSSDPCHATGGGPERENAARNASVHRQLTVDARGIAWVAFLVEDQPSPFASSVADVETPRPADFLPQHMVRPLVTVDTLFGYTWRGRDVGARGGGTAILRVEAGASVRKKWRNDVSPSQNGASYGGYAELGTTGDQDFVAGGGATTTFYGGPLGLSLSAGGYGRVTSVNAGGVAVGAFLGLRNFGHPDYGDWEPETPFGVRVEGRFGLDAHPEQSVAVMVEVAPLSLLTMGAGIGALFHMSH